MRADRLLSILLMMQVHRHMTARDLARRLEVSERTIYRDMEALGVAGVPVYAERGTNGGWFLQSNYQTKLTGLSEPEIQALFMTPATHHALEDLGLQKASETALIKLLASLPVLFQRDAEFARQRIHIDAAGWHAQQKEPVPSLPVLQEAIWQERKVRFGYQRGNGECVEREASPLGLVVKGQTWYLAALTVPGEDGMRTYRVSRIREVRMLDEQSIRPADFDLATFWEQSTATFKSNLPRYPVTLRAQTEVLPRLRMFNRHPILKEEGPDAEGWMTLTMRFEMDWEACEFLLSWGALVEVQEPRELRDMIIASAKSIVELYQQKEQKSESVVHQGVYAP